MLMRLDPRIIRLIIVAAAELGLQLPGWVQHKTTILPPVPPP
jgi:hypothetical protein